MSHETGILISCEGSEGCGKSTQIRLLADRLEEVDHREVVVTREPGGTLIGEDIRHLLMHADSSQQIFPEAELLLFAASRAQLVRELILPYTVGGSSKANNLFSLLYLQVIYDKSYLYNLIIPIGACSSLSTISTSSKVISSKLIMYSNCPCSS